jgi:L-asparagine transporter-like permease
MKQTSYDRKKLFRNMLKDLRNKFILVFLIGLLIIMLLPNMRMNPLSYIVLFFLSFSISFFFIFFRAKEKPEELMKGDD